MYIFFLPGTDIGKIRPSDKASQPHTYPLGEKNPFLRCCFLIACPKFTLRICLNSTVSCAAYGYLEGHNPDKEASMTDKISPLKRFIRPCLAALTFGTKKNVTVHQKQGMCSLPRNCNRLPGAPDARKRPAMCASAHEQAADKADGVPGERLQRFHETNS